MKWNIKKFKELVRFLYGHEQLEKVKIPLNSLFWKLMLSKYHSEESKKIYRSYFSGKREEYVEATINVLLAASGSEKANQFKEAFIFSEAHVIAYAQALHSTVDILSQIIYYSFNLKQVLTHPLYSSQISLNKIYDILTQEGIAENVTNAIEKLKKSPEFCYLQAYVNITKHRSLVDTTHRVSFQTKRYGIVIRPFEYKGDNFLQKWANDFVNQDFEEMQKRLITIGNEMNQYLEGKV
ncbi:MAG: hypothetical protein ACOCP4_02720 [Candidatus Woesearchaeota archaeon]